AAGEPLADWEKELLGAPAAETSTETAGS
ncbi:MAG: 30S ribosomal protein S2, partial [Actinobacteria bacterium]|nr:30S ribosomal protein S2 [Actinomycetota bacterium]